MLQRISIISILYSFIKLCCFLNCDLGIKNTYQQYLDKNRHYDARCKVCCTFY